MHDETTPGPDAPRVPSHHPFAELIELRVLQQRAGSSVVALTVGEQHLNPHHVVHGAVLYALADTGMGAALYPTLEPGEICATIEIKINYFKPVAGGEVVCRTELVNRGRTVANLDARLHVDGVLVAQANGNYAIFRPGRVKAG
jgi:acyl-CoA thioesterase